MQIFASTYVTASGRAPRRPRARVQPAAMLAYRARLAALLARAPHLLRARIRREPRAAAELASRR
jgi:hypothetical protein